MAVDVLRVPLPGIEAEVILLHRLGDLTVIPVKPQGGEDHGQAQDGQERPQKPGIFSFFHDHCPLSGPSIQFDAALKSRGFPVILCIAQESMCRVICFDEALYRLHNNPVIR